MLVILRRVLCDARRAAKERQQRRHAGGKTMGKSRGRARRVVMRAATTEYDERWELRGLPYVVEEVGICAGLSYCG